VIASEDVELSVMKTVLTKLNGIADILAQAPSVSAAFGRWLGFILMMTAMLVVFCLALAIMVVAIKALNPLAYP
jgi:hypothetical protein